MTKIKENQDVSDTDAECPDWIEGGADLSGSCIEAIQQGGCASGAFMPAVTYHAAMRTMAEHGNDVLDYINDALGELPTPSDCESWSGMAEHYLSVAVELWASGFEVVEDDDESEDQDDD